MGVSMSRATNWILRTTGQDYKDAQVWSCPSFDTKAKPESEIKVFFKFSPAWIIIDFFWNSNLTEKKRKKKVTTEFTDAERYLNFPHY